METLWQGLVESAICGDAAQGGLDITAKNIELVHAYEQSPFQKSPMEVAIMNGHFNWLKEMFEKLGISADPDEKEPDEQIHGLEETQEPKAPENRPSTIEVAIAWGDTEMVRLLLEYGVNIEQMDLDSL